MSSARQDCKDYVVAEVVTDLQFVIALQTEWPQPAQKKDGPHATRCDVWQLAHHMHCKSPDIVVVREKGNQWAYLWGKPHASNLAPIRAGQHLHNFGKFVTSTHTCQQHCCSPELEPSLPVLTLPVPHSTYAA